MMESSERTTLVKITSFLPRVASIDDVIIAITKACLWASLAFITIGIAMLLAKFFKYALIPYIMDF